MTEHLLQLPILFFLRLLLSLLARTPLRLHRCLLRRPLHLEQFANTKNHM